MLSIAKINSTEYYEQLEKSEYYASNDEQSSGEPKGRWCAEAEEIGLDVDQGVSNYELRQTMLGFKPNGEAMTQNAGRENARLGMDLTFSAPKSVSVVWANADAALREQISTAQERAVTRAMEYLRDNAEARRGHNGLEKETPKALLFATFEHCDSRLKDPQLHTHTVLANACVRSDGSTGAIDEDSIFQAKGAAGALYRAELAQGLRQLGFAIEQDPKNEAVFRVAGVDEKLVDHFSKRTLAIKEKCEELGITSKQSEKTVSLSLREAKTEVNRPAQFERWQAESVARGFSMNAVKATQAQAFAMPSNSQILEKLTEQESFFEAKDVDQILAELRQFSEFDFTSKRAEVLADAECVSIVSNGFRLYTSQTLINTERQVIESAQARNAETSHHLQFSTVALTIQRIENENNYTLRDEQREAVEHLTQKSGGVALLQGLAGTGKTTALKTVSEAFKTEGFKCYGATISAQAAGVLSQETGIKSATIAQTLIDLDNGKLSLDARSVLVLDECGMVGSRDFARLQAHCDSTGAKLIAVGDDRQLQAISSGGIFGALQKHAGLTASTLSQITRQRDSSEQQASQLFRDGKADEALKIYEQRGSIQTRQTRAQVFEKMTQDYVSDSTPSQAKAMLASTKAECLTLNSLTRDALKERGDIGQRGAFFKNHDGDVLEMSTGDRVLFKQNSKKADVVNNMRGTVERVIQVDDNAILKIRGDDGKLRTVDTNDYAHLRHAYAVTNHAAQGATVERSFVLYNRGTADLSSAYVSMTRHKDSTTLYATDGDRERMAEKMSRAAFKGTTLDLVHGQQQSQQQQAQGARVTGGMESANAQQAAQPTQQTAATQTAPTPTPAPVAPVMAGPRR